MAANNDMKNKMIQTSSRQKLIMIVMVIVVLIIIWQVMGLMGGGESSPPAIQPVAKMNANAPGDKGAAANKDQPAAAQADQVAAMASNRPQETLKQGTIVNDPQFVNMQRVTEEKYIGKLNELEELRIQRQIAETNQAIAAAKLATVTAEKDISDLLTRPSQSGFSSYASSTARNSTDVNAQGEATTAAVPIPQPVQELVPYNLISVSMLLNKWNAVIGLQGSTYTVGVGDILPPDGSVVTNISKNSVTLRKDGKSRKIGITTSLQ